MKTGNTVRHQNIRKTIVHGLSDPWILSENPTIKLGWFVGDEYFTITVSVFDSELEVE